MKESNSLLKTSLLAVTLWIAGWKINILLTSSTFTYPIQTMVLRIFSITYKYRTLQKAERWRNPQEVCRKAHNLGIRERRSKGRNSERRLQPNDYHWWQIQTILHWWPSYWWGRVCHAWVRTRSSRMWGKCSKLNRENLLKGWVPLMLSKSTKYIRADCIIKVDY